MKRIALTALSIILLTFTVAAFGGCASSDSGSESSAASSEVSQPEGSGNYDAMQSEAEAQNSKAQDQYSSTDESKVNTVRNEYEVTYLTWTATEWAKASDTEKTECARAYLGYIGDLMGMKVTTDDAAQLETIVPKLEAAMKANPEFSIKEIVVYSLASDEDSASSAE